MVEKTTWSKPDSTGTQYPVETTKTHRHTSTGQKNDIKTNKDAETHVAEQSDVNDNSKIKTSTEEQTKEQISTKTSTPSWLNFLIIGILAVVVIVILVILRHYHVI